MVQQGVNSRFDLCAEYTESVEMGENPLRNKDGDNGHQIISLISNVLQIFTCTGTNGWDVIWWWLP